MSPSTAVRMEGANDTEITLGTGKMLALFFGLVILCAVFFGMGFSMGKNSVRSTPELLPSRVSPTRGRRPVSLRVQRRPEAHLSQLRHLQRRLRQPTIPVLQSPLLRQTNRRGSPRLRHQPDQVILYKLQP